MDQVGVLGRDASATCGVTGGYMRHEPNWSIDQIDAFRRFTDEEFRALMTEPRRGQEPRWVGILRLSVCLAAIFGLCMLWPLIGTALK